MNTYMKLLTTTSVCACIRIQYSLQVLHPEHGFLAETGGADPVKGIC